MAIMEHMREWRRQRAAKAEVHALSAVAHQGLEPVLQAAWALVSQRRAAAAADAA